jgi:hypothetical protein
VLLTLAENGLIERFFTYELVVGRKDRIYHDAFVHLNEILFLSSSSSSDVVESGEEVKLGGRQEGRKDEERLIFHDALIAEVEAEEF